MGRGNRWGVNYDHSQIIELLEDGKRATDIVEIVGCSLPMVYKVAREIGYNFKPRYSLDGNEQRVSQILAEGGNYSDIAREFGVDGSTAKLFCERKNLGKPKEFNGDDYAVETIVERLPEFEYVSGYSGWDSRVNIRCKKCGTIQNRSWITIRKGVAVCSVCRSIESSQRREEKKSESESVRERKQKEKELRSLLKEQKEKQKLKDKTHKCPVCGCDTTRPKYCSYNCRSKVYNKQKEIKRRSIIKERMIDNNITVQALYNRDGGVCYLCGKQCRFDDYITAGETIICGDWYPSIDHVIPLAKGGEHSWSNVRLAHRRCNSVKSDRVYPLG